MQIHVKKVAVLSIALGLAVAAWLHFSQKRNERLLLHGDAIVELVEQYKAQHGTLPVDLKQAGVQGELGEPIFYKKESDSKYRVWIERSYNDTLYFDSDAKIWE